MKILLVKIFSDDDGVPYDKDEQFWHLVTRYGDADRTFCSGEVFGEGEGKATFQTKTVERGITCPKCREYIKFIKSVKL